MKQRFKLLYAGLFFVLRRQGIPGLVPLSVWRRRAATAES